MPAHPNFFKNYLSEMFYESGTHTGDGVQYARNAGFPKIISTELSPVLAARCKTRFNDSSHIEIICGDSLAELPKILEANNDKHITFWLDGHYSGGETAGTDNANPLLQELDIIINAKLKHSPIVIIDDVRIFKKEFCGFDLEEIYSKLKMINPNFVYSLEDGFQETTGNVFKEDILVARPPS